MRREVTRIGKRFSGRGLRIATERDAEGRVWCQLFPMGTWHRADFPKEGLELDTRFFEELVEAWKAEGSPALPVDYHHEDQDEAAGWIEDLRITSAGLEGAIKWTSDAAELIAQDKYRYLSPTWSMTHTVRTSGERGGAWLYGAGLLNDPFFHTMPRVAASAEAETAQPNPNKEQHMSFQKRIAAAFGMPEDTSEDALVAAFDSFCKSKASQSETVEKLTAANKSSAAEAAKLAARVEVLEAADKAHKEALFERDFEAVFAAGLAEGRSGLPAMKDVLKATAKALPAADGLESVKKLIAGMAVLPMKASGIAGTTTGDASDAAKAAKELDALIEARRKETAGLTYHQAARLVQSENKELTARAYSAPINPKLSAEN